MPRISTSKAVAIASTTVVLLRFSTSILALLVQVSTFEGAINFTVPGARSAEVEV